MPDWDIAIYDVLDSTQSLLINEAESGVPEGRVIQAKRQEHGRGRHGNHWASPPGNLYCSLLLRPGYAAHEGQWASLSYCAGLGLARTLSAHVGQRADIRLKWPNDILINNKKVSGILLDMQLRANKPDWVVIGVGVNVDDSLDSGTYLNAHCNINVFIDQIRDEFLYLFSSIYKDWIRFGFVPFHDQWLSYAPDLQGRITARTQYGEIVGTFVELDQSGALCLRDDAEQLHKITAGDIHNVRDVSF
jgi:BirA family biotin operon repressor/biotin-[acetyl-CoA-carboxylase] ligase